MRERERERYLSALYTQDGLKVLQRFVKILYIQACISIFFYFYVYYIVSFLFTFLYVSRYVTGV